MMGDSESMVGVGVCVWCGEGINEYVTGTGQRSMMPKDSRG